MHEYSLVQALLQRVEAEARARGATAVRKVRVQLGRLAGVDPTLFATAYDTFRAACTICADAELEVDPVPALWACSRCGTSITWGAPLRCNACGAPARLVQGDELMLASLDLEVPEEKPHV